MYADHTILRSDFEFVPSWYVFGFDQTSRDIHNIICYWFYDDDGVF
jgi:hypothetical protein